MKYQEKEGIVYPVLEEEQSLKKYGRMIIKYMKENQEIRYSYLLTSGELMSIVRKAQEEAYNLEERIIKEYLQKNPHKDPQNTMLTYQENLQAEMIAEEIVMKEVIYRQR